MENKTKYDPSIKYGWNNDDIFKFTGNEFGAVYKLLGDFINTPVSLTSMLRIMDAFNIMQAKIKEGVESGFIQPAKEEESQIETIKKATKEATKSKKSAKKFLNDAGITK